MATSKNDKVILTLKKQVEEKRKAIEKSERFSPITNCSIEIDGKRDNIQTLSKEQLMGLLAKLVAYKNAAQEVGFLEEYTICGYDITDWIADLQSRFAHMTRTAEKAKLKILEDKLQMLLSNEKKVELELEEIAKQIG